MQVFKFGGASIKDAPAMQNVANILQHYTNQPLIIVISALGKTTNQLEDITDAYFYAKPTLNTLFEQLKQSHINIALQLFENDTNQQVFKHLNHFFEVLQQRFNQTPVGTYNFIYDQIVCLGELLSTVIMSHYLNYKGISNTWLDVRQMVRTDNTYREGQVLWAETELQITQKISQTLLQTNIVIVQGFLGGTVEGFTTTLGREGSDYTAAIFANILNATQQTIWKDVPCVLNADPRLVPNAIPIPKLSYYEAIEMTYYGAQVIHPKTIKPLQNKNIPLIVRSFLDPTQPSTTIYQPTQAENLPPIIVIKKNQLLISIATKDFSFVAEENLSAIYTLFAKHHIKINLSQNAAITFSVVIDDIPTRINDLLAELKNQYTIRTNSDLQLITIRHYTPESIAQHIHTNNILLEQKSRHTLQVLVKNS